MEWDLSRVYTALNADEVKVGSIVCCSNSIRGLKNKVKANDRTEIKEIAPDCYEHRFRAFYEDELSYYSLCYLIEEPEEKVLKWTDLKIGDVIRYKLNNRLAMVTIVDDIDGEAHICAGGKIWLSDKDLEQWEKVE